MKKTLFRTAAAAFFLAAAAVLASCGASSVTSSAKPAMNAAPQEKADGAYKQDQAGYPGEDGGFSTEALGMPESGLTDTAAGGMSPGGPRTVSPGGTVPEGTSADGSQTDMPQDGRKLIRNVDMDVETDEFDSLLSRISDQIRALGGYVGQSEVLGRRTNYLNVQQPRSAQLTVRIPSDKLDRFVTAVETNGNVISKSENTEDVTLKYSDIESKKKSLTVEQDRLWALLEKADTLESVIMLEERLSEIRYELESMESQLRLYDSLVDYSTVELRIEEVTAFTPTAPESAGQRIRSGFSKNLQRASAALTNWFVALAAGSPIWVPLAVILGLILYFIRRRGKKAGIPGSKGRLKSVFHKKAQKEESKEQEK